MKIRNLLTSAGLLIAMCCACARGDITDADNEILVSKLPHYKVFADVTFTVNHKIGLAAAFEEWNAKTDNLVQFDLEFTNASKMGKFADNTIYVYYASDLGGALGTTKWYAWNNFSSINVLQRITDDELFVTVLLHEIGHSLKLAHSTDKRAIMYPTVWSGQRVECVDIKAFCDKWNCFAACDPDEAVTTANIVTMQSGDDIITTGNNSECNTMTRVKK